VVPLPSSPTHLSLFFSFSVLMLDSIIFFARSFLRTARGTHRLFFPIPLPTLLHRPFFFSRAGFFLLPLSSEVFFVPVTRPPLFRYADPVSVFCRCLASYGGSGAFFPPYRTHPRWPPVSSLDLSLCGPSALSLVAHRFCLCERTFGRL